MSLLVACVLAQPAPTTSPAATRPKPTRRDPAWGSPAAMAIPDKGEPIFAANNGRFAMVKGELYNLDDFKLTSQLTDKSDPPGKCALSNDGQYLAVASGFGNNPTVNIVHVPSSTRAFQLPIDGPLQLLEFVGPQTLLVGQSLVPTKVFTLDIKTGARGPVCAIDNLDERGWCVSPEGEYFATDHDGKVRVFSLETAEIVANMQAPPRGDRGFLGKAAGMRFSPDGNELAALYGYPTTRLLVWNPAGTLVLDLLPPVDLNDTNLIAAASYKSNGLEWLPKGDAWLLCGKCVVSRETKLPVWIASGGPGSNGPNKLISQYHLVYRLNNFRNRALVRVTIPWEQIHAIEKNMATVPAHIAPGQAVSIEVKLGPVRFAKAEDVQASLKKALTQRLAQMNIKVADNQPGTFMIQYEEKSAGALKFRKFGIHKGSDEVSFDSTEGTGTVSLFAAGIDQAVWGATFEAGPNRFMEFYTGDSTAEAYREKTFQDALERLKQTAPPYFLAQKEEDGSLPLITRLGQTGE